MTQINQPFNPLGVLGSTNGLQLGLGLWATDSVGRTTNSINLASAAQSGFSTISSNIRIPFQFIRQA